MENNTQYIMTKTEFNHDGRAFIQLEFKSDVLRHDGKPIFVSAIIRDEKDIPSAIRQAENTMRLQGLHIA
jgi:hypothetical protein